jgi:adenine-specific DNA-methyltransferase
MLDDEFRPSLKGRVEIRGETVQRRKPLTRRQGLKASFAKQLRASSTDAERKLWSILRNHQVAGLRFRRQQPIGPYVGDFYCSAAKLIVELDGDQHGADNNVASDALRSQWLASNGYRVLRFPNWQVLKNPQIVLDEIARMFEIRAVPSPRID